MRKAEGRKSTRYEVRGVACEVLSIKFFGVLLAHMAKGRRSFLRRLELHLPKIVCVGVASRCLWKIIGIFFAGLGVESVVEKSRY